MDVRRFVENWDDLSGPLEVETLPPYRVHADSTAFFLTPVNGKGPSARIGSFRRVQSTTPTPVETPAAGGRDLSRLTAFLDTPQEVVGNGGTPVTDLREVPWPNQNDGDPAVVGARAAGSMTEALDAGYWLTSSRSNGDACISVTVVVLGPGTGR